MMNREELLRDIEAEIAESMERLKFAADLAKSGLHSLTIVNGGALIALFTLIGTGKLGFAPVPLWWAFGCFVIGIALSLVAYLAGYASQNAFYCVSAHRSFNIAAELARREPDKEVQEHLDAGNRYLRCAILAAAGSIFTFVIGAGLALMAFTAG